MGFSVFASHNYTIAYELHDSLPDICLPLAGARDDSITLTILPVL
jgi:hypothetical protein